MEEQIQKETACDDFFIVYSDELCALSGHLRWLCQRHWWVPRWLLRKKAGLLWFWSSWTDYIGGLICPKRAYLQSGPVKGRGTKIICFLTISINHFHSLSYLLSRKLFNYHLIISTGNRWWSSHSGELRGTWSQCWSDYERLIIPCHKSW